MPAVVRSIEIHAPPSVVWRWLSTPEALRQWFHPGLEIDLRVGGRYSFHDPDSDDRVNGTVLELIPEGSLILSWMEEGAGGHPARLVVALAPTAAGTRVTVTYDRFAGIGKPNWADTVEAYERGADRHQDLERLAAFVAHGVA